MARGPICNFCDEKLAPKQVFCGKCGHPTEHASHDERVLWDLGQWEVSRRKSASAGPNGNDRAEESAVRTKELFRSAQSKRASVDRAPAGRDGTAPASPGAPEERSRFMIGRVRREPPRETRAPAASTQPSPPAAPARQAPVRPAPSNGGRGARPGPPAKPASTTHPGRTMAPERPAPARATAPPQATISNGHGSVEALAKPVAPAEPRSRIPDRPLVTIRKAAVEPEASSAPPQAARATPAPAKPGRAERKAAQDQAREQERVREQARKDAERAAEEKKKQEAARRAAQLKDEERRRKEEAKAGRKRERKHRRHAKRVGRRTLELDLREGERVSLSIEGWSRLRRATLIVTNYRVALITRIPPQVRWIPLEEVEGVHHRWRGAHSLVVASPIEVLTLQKAKREMLGSFEQLLESEVSEARRPGSSGRHHGDITQEWCDRSTEIWDSHFGRIRLWVRRHPVVAFGLIAVFASAAFVIASFFSGYR